MKTTLGSIRRADEEYGLIQPGDKVAVGVSGGKDSLLLLYAMSLYRRVRHEDFDLCAIMLLTGKEPPDISAIQALAEQLNVPLLVRNTELYQILFEIRKDPNPCALCAKMRRAMLCDACRELGANKLALGHHRDDALETLLMSLLFEGRLHTFHPCSYMSRSQLTVIRPLIFLPEKHVIHMQRTLGLPVLDKTCPVDGHTKRQEMKELLDELCRRYPTAREMMLRALRNHDQYGLWAPGDAQKDVRGCGTKVRFDSACQKPQERL